MNFKEITRMFYEMEHDLSLLEKKIEDVYFWELIRFKVHRSILQKKGVIKSGHNKPPKNLHQIILIIISNLKGAILKNPFFSKKIDILFWGHPRRKKREDGFWWDVHCDPIINYLSKDYECLLLEPPHLNSHKSPTKTIRIKYTDFFRFAFLIFKTMKAMALRKPAFKNPTIADIEKEILTRFSVDIKLEKLVLNKISSKSISVSMFSSLLKKLNPKVVFIVVSYGNEFFIEACKNLNIKVIELQHGAGVSWHHLGYSYPNGSKRLFPDYLFVFGEFWKRRIDYPVKDKNVIATGNPYHEIETKKYLNEKKIDQTLIVSQGNVGKEMSEFALALQNDKNFNHKIVYKLHPGEYLNWQENYLFLQEAGITVIADDSEPLYRIIAQSKILIGVSSTVIYESLDFDLEIYLLNLPGIDYMQELVDEGRVTVISDVAEFMAVIGNPSDKKASGEYFYQRDALKNISDQLHIINTSNY